MSLKKEIKDKIERFADREEKSLLWLMVSRKDFRRLAKEISKHKGGFADTTITIDDIRIHSSENMPFEKGKRIESITT